MSSRGAPQFARGAPLPTSTGNGRIEQRSGSLSHVRASRDNVTPVLVMSWMAASQRQAMRATFPRGHRLGTHRGWQVRKVLYAWRQKKPCREAGLL